tara:strand:+ start:2111 stop:3898 length:1788 start_codon:yes stop_codon:yes gene_type:complete
MSNPNQDVLLTRNLKLDLLNRTVANTWLRIVSEDVDAALRQCKKTECTRTDVIKTAVERHAYDMHGLLDHERHLLVGPEDGADGSVGLVDLTRLRLHARHLEGVSRGELTATLGAHPDTLETDRLLIEHDAAYRQLRLQMCTKRGLCLPVDPMSRCAARSSRCTVTSSLVPATPHCRAWGGIVTNSPEFNSLHLFQPPMTVPPLSKLGEGHVSEATCRLGTLLYIWKKCRPRKYVMVLQHMISFTVTHVKLVALTRELQTVLTRYQAARDARAIQCPLLRISGDAGTDEQPGQDVGDSFLSHLPPAHAWRLMRTCKAMRDWLVRNDRYLKFRLVQQGDMGDPVFPAHGIDDQGRNVVRKDRVLHLRPQWYFECLYDTGLGEAELRPAVYEVPYPDAIVCPRRSKYVFKLLRDENPKRLVEAAKATDFADEPRRQQVFNGSDPCISRKAPYGAANDFVVDKCCKFSLVIDMLSRFLPKDQNTMRIQATAELAIVDAQGVQVGTVRHSTVTEPFLCVAKIESAQTKANAKRRQDTMLSNSKERTKRVKQRVELANERLKREELERAEHERRAREQVEVNEMGELVVGQDWLDSLITM